MRKIPTIFERDPGDRAHVLPEINPACQWVFDGEGHATRMYDGTCMKLDGEGRWWARREVKAGKNPPPGYVREQYDEVTHKTVGWEPVEQSGFAKFHAEALAHSGHDTGFRAGTYELVGPKINGNPERVPQHLLIEHAKAALVAVEDLTFAGIRTAVFLAAVTKGCEGIVWHHLDGRMAKIKARDFRTE